MRALGMKYVLMVADMERATAFYRDTFGLTVGIASPYWTEVSIGDATIGLHAGGDGTFTRTGLSIQVDDIHGAVAAIVEHGGTIRMEPQDREGEPIFLAEATDPEGNGFAVSQMKPM